MTSGWLTAEEAAALWLLWRITQAKAGKEYGDYYCPIDGEWVAWEDDHWHACPVPIMTWPC